VIVGLVCLATKGLLRHHRVEVLPDSAASVLVGMIAGLICQGFDIKAQFSESLFLRIMLPMIIFEAALSINKRQFARQLWPIATFAMLGTLVASCVCGLIVYASRYFGVVSLPLADCLVFGALISSVDPVSILAVFNSLGVDPSSTLYVLVLGESILNDGAAVVLFDSFVSFLGDKPAGTMEILDATGNFLLVAVG
jgi:NhaP-type Na+/H+ or K+/H+ antiporter